jgi:hypothetical protein
LLDKVNVFGVPVTPTFCAEYVKLAGVSAACAMLVPESGTVCGLPAASSVKLSVSVAAPSCDGANVTLTWHVLPAASVLPQALLEMEKLVPSERAMLLRFSVAVPLFLSVTVLAAPLVLAASLPKFSEAGESEASGAEGVMVKVSGMLCVKPPFAVPVTVTVAAPNVAVGLALTRSVLVLVAGFGLNDAVTPLGMPE